MTDIPDKLLIQACKDLQARTDNHGGWPDKKIPDSIEKIRKLMKVPSYNPAWTLTIEAAVKNRAVEFVSRSN